MSRPAKASRSVLLLTGLQVASAALALVLAAGYAAYGWIIDSAGSCELDQVTAPLIFTCCAVVALGLAIKGSRTGIAIAAVLPAVAQVWMLLWRAPLYDWPMQVFLMPLGELTRAPYPAMMLATDLLAMLSIPLGMAATVAVAVGARTVTASAEGDPGRVRQWAPPVVLMMLAFGAAGMYELSFWVAELAERKALLFINGPMVRDRALAVAGAAMVAAVVEVLGMGVKGRRSRWASGAAGIVMLIPACWDVWEMTRALLSPQSLSSTIDAFASSDWTVPVSEGLNMGAWQATMLALALAVLLGIAGILRSVWGPDMARNAA